jgi:hypothetical protein
MTVVGRQTDAEVHRGDQASDQQLDKQPLAGACGPHPAVGPGDGQGWDLVVCSDRQRWRSE